MVTGGFPSTPILDTFTRPNGAIGPNWGTPVYSADSPPTIDTNVVIGPGSTFVAGYWLPDKFLNSDAYLTLTGSSFSQVTLYSRISDPNLVTVSYYDLIFEAGVDVILDRTNSGTPATLTTFPVRPVDGWKLGMKTKTVGPDIILECWIDPGTGWAMAGSYTDVGAVATYPLLAPAGYIGFRQYSGGNTSRSFDNFGGGASISQPAPTTRVLDTFDRPDGSPGPNWAVGMSAYTVPDIVSNALDFPDFPSGYWTPTQFGANQEAFVSIAPGQPTTYPSVLLRWTNPGGGSEVGYNVAAALGDVGGTRPAAIWSYTAGLGSQVLLYYANEIMLSTDISMWVTIIGKQINIYGSPDYGATWFLRLTFSDSSIISGPGYIGLFSQNNIGGNSRLNNFGGGTIPSGPTGKMRTDRRRSRRTSW